MSAATPDIQDIRAPYLIPADWRMAAAIAAGVVLLLAVGFWFWRRWRARQPPLTLLERTLRQLDATQGLMQAGDARAFSVAVSDIVRAYVEERFNVQAAHLTTPEFLRACVKQVGSALEAHEQSLGEFLKFCDLAKFARWSLDAAEMQGMLASARQFVQATATATPAPAAIATEAVHVPIRQS